MTKRDLSAFLVCSSLSSESEW